MYCAYPVPLDDAHLQKWCELGKFERGYIGQTVALFLTYRVRVALETAWGADIHIHTPGYKVDL